MLELNYNFFDQFCEFDSFDETEIDTDSPNQDLSQHPLEDCIKPEMKETWMNINQQECSNNFSAIFSSNFFPRTCCSEHIEYKREPGVFKEECRCTETNCLCSKTYCCFDQNTKKTGFSSKGINRILEETGVGPLEKHKRVLEKKTNVQSTNRGFRTMQDSLCTYEQTKRGLS